MAYTRVKLIDPANVLAPYTWDVGYNQEGEFGQRRNLERSFRRLLHEGVRGSLSGATRGLLAVFRIP